MKTDKYKNSKSRKSKIRDWEKDFNRKMTWSIIEIILFMIAWAIFQMLPALQPIRDSIVYSIIMRTLFSGLIVYFTWFHSGKPEIVGKIISTIIAIYFWLPLIINSSQILVLFRTLAFLIIFIYTVILFLLKRKCYGVIIAEVLYFGMSLILDLSDYEFVNNPTGLHFWLIPLIIASISAIICVVLIMLDKIDMRTSELIALPFVVFMFMFAVPWCTINNLNYSLDTKEPVEKIVIIEDAEIDSEYRQPTEYFFHLSMDGKNIKISVSQSDFYKYEIGESYPVKIYQGAFNEPFYISGNR